MNFMTTKQTKTTSCHLDTIPYVGLPIPSKWRLTSAGWSKRFDLMVKYHQGMYDTLPSQKDHPIAPRLIAHKAVVLEIQLERQGGWLPAFRYNIAQRQNVWEHRLPDGRISDVGTGNQILVTQALRDLEMAKDELFNDNPYAIGFTRQNMSPIDGHIYPEHASWDNFNIPNKLKLEGTGGRLMSAFNPLQSFSQNKNSFQAGPSQGRGGFRGGKGSGVGGRGNGRGSHFNGPRRPYLRPQFNWYQPSLYHQNNPGNGYTLFNQNNQFQAFRPAIGPGSFQPQPKQLLLENSSGGGEKGKGPANGNKCDPMTS
ncbi:uncharacterized protein MELLADRAFT_92727 [Melampsora larici-populina 98AG31]|uniref:Uncharacterized protein n=1 Tax=Melampsora larici-populina (strain 98AG31 / pathotype 3-4-7) TaxID=747676 RepID=F4S2V6_MELLP|nr:uncharacterized protein MELLADRAFT_92727 [Melampsora larici-populina 98AG31]EGG01009.1 hypothetical protein MELLADRAFT_92727 [Melampsora larici-populina 98AG31]